MAVLAVLWPILLLIADSILGGWLIRREGRRAWQALTAALNSGQMPAKELADGPPRAVASAYEGASVRHEVVADLFTRKALVGTGTGARTRRRSR